jgi:hypothetical protein
VLSVVRPPIELIKQLTDTSTTTTTTGQVERIHLNTTAVDRAAVVRHPVGVALGQCHLAYIVLFSRTRPVCHFENTLSHRTLEPLGRSGGARLPGPAGRGGGPCTRDVTLPFPASVHATFIGRRTIT